MLALIAVLISPTDVFDAVHADLAKLPAEVRTRVRYLDLSQIPEKSRGNAVKVLAGHCNQLSRTAILTPPVRVNEWLLRVVLEDYSWDPLVWDRLSEEEPYYTIRVVEDWPGGVYPYDGKTYAAGSFRVNRAYPAIWAGTKAPEVWTWTQSKAPVVRADWWFNRTAAQAERAVGYYDFLGIKDESSFQDLIGFDRKRAEKFRVEIRESVADSGVTLQPRAITRHDALGGGYWRSLDYKTAVNAANPLRVLGREQERHYDASEQFGVLPNGLWATGLFDAKGVRQDYAPPDIASDGQSKSNDKRVHVNVSCIRCHVEGGMRPIDGWARNLLSPPVALRTPDYAASLLLRQQYVRGLEPFLDRDRKQYESAIKEATGMDGKTYAKAYGEFWESYEDGRIGIEQAAVSLGVKVEDFRAKLIEAAKANALDPVLGVFLLEGPRRRTIGIRQWEEVYPAAQSLMGWFRKAIVGEK